MTAVILRIWDRAVRALHWALVVAVALAAISTVALVGAHRPAGYVALAIVALRVLWGVVGSGYARFAQFVRTPRATLAYLRQLAAQREPRYLGHNPLGGWMVLALMACVSGLALTGWLYTTDAFWGSEAVEDAHRALAWLLLGLVLAHVGGVIFTSLRQRENLVAAMFSGVKRAPETHDIR
jgi:cytochrome b